MLLRIQPDESLRSFVERNLFLQLPTRALEIFGAPQFRHRRWRNKQVKSIATLLGWDGCYGFNKLLHSHTDYTIYGVLKAKDSFSYSSTEFEAGSFCFDDFSRTRSYCPVCAKEDLCVRGYSYWRRNHPLLNVCAKHNVELLASCQFCRKPFSVHGHSLDVMWSGCVGRSLGDAEPTANTKPEALNLAEFFSSLNALPYHLSAETVFHVLEAKIIELIESDSFNLMSRGRRATLNFYRDDLRDPHAFRFLVGRSQLHELLYLIASVFKSFESFLGDYLRQDPNPPSIDSYWNSHHMDGYPPEESKRGAGKLASDDIHEEMKDLFERLGNPFG